MSRALPRGILATRLASRGIMHRGFLLSLDALFALSLILLGLSFFALRPSTDATAGAALFLGGRDVLDSGGLVESDLLRRGWSVSNGVPPSSSSGLAVRADAFFYPHLCSDLVSNGSACLNNSDATLVPSSSVVWVGSG